MGKSPASKNERAAPQEDRARLSDTNVGDGDRFPGRKSDRARRLVISRDEANKQKKPPSTEDKSRSIPTQGKTLDSSGKIAKQQYLDSYGRVVGGTETSTTHEVSDASRQITNDEILNTLSRRGVSADLLRQVAAALIAAERPRPLWVERGGHEDLAHLNAPRFLKEVYSDLFDAAGNLTNEDVVRLRDPVLVQTVQTYINDRENAGKGLRDAKGISFPKKDTRGRPRITKRRERNRAPSLS